VTVHVTMLGGGFGRRSKEDFAIDAVQISKAAGRPVKVTWTREEDIQHDFFRVDGLQRLRAVLDAQGNVVSWEDRVVGPSTEAYGNPNSNPQRRYDAARRPPYNFANQKLEFVYVPSPVPLWFWRAVANTQDGYCMEAFMDEVAQAAGKDPVQFRLAALEGQPRMQEVVRLAAEKSGWGTPLPAGQGRGIAFYDYDGTFVAQVVEVEVPANGRVKVNRVTCAFDCGQLINPDTVKAQVESAIGWALSAALYGEITVKNGEVEQSNFDTYQVARINEMPRVDVHLVENHETPTGVGEPGVPPFIPAMLNAIHAATGVRLRRTPITPQALIAAMKHPVTENQGVR
jgi:isoquinoline 1-oxidoreductase beta subunit